MSISRTINTLALHINFQNNNPATREETDVGISESKHTPVWFLSLLMRAKKKDPPLARWCPRRGFKERNFFLHGIIHTHKS